MATTSLGSGIAVQVGAYQTAVAAMNAIAQLARVTPHLLDHKLNRLEPLRAGNRVVYRALIIGFADEAEAGRFCRTLTRARHLCLVRRVR